MSENDFPKLGINTQELINAIEADIAEARRLADSGENFGAVNWGDIGVADIEYRLSMMRPEDGAGAYVIVEEAAPDCKLGQWLNDRIDRERFPVTYIECEW